MGNGHGCGEGVRLAQVALGAFCALALACGVMTTTACSRGARNDEPALEEAVPADDAPDRTADETAQAEEGDNPETAQAETEDDEQQALAEAAVDPDLYGTWAEECMDKWNDPTVYAISELKGWQLQTLLREKGYTWNKEDSCWFDGSTTLAVYGEDYKPLDQDAISALGKGGVGSAVFYHIVTPNYPTCGSGYEGLVGEVMVSEDAQFTEDYTAAFGVAYGPSLKRLLVEMVADDRGLQVYVFPDEALEAGIFDKATEGSYGSTVSEVFQSMVGRAPGSAH